jgi:hypothetical protein
MMAEASSGLNLARLSAEIASLRRIGSVARLSQPHQMNVLSRIWLAQIKTRAGPIRGPLSTFRSRFCTSSRIPNGSATWNAPESK